ncbi:hypothetical protein [Kitasatospora griseola]|uniref:hypothetical protein n=1 Tax=Kitasatospora griseola TaxID=2064 RepID=UPI003419C1C3
MAEPTVGAPPAPGAAAAHAASALLDWAAEPRPDRPRAVVITGPSGAGKTRFLAQFLAASGRNPRITVHATGFAEGQIARTLAWQLGRHLGYGPLDPDRLTLRLRSDPRPVLLVVTDLHRAGRGPGHLPSASPAAVVSELLGPLLALPNVRMIVESDTADLLGAEEPLVLRLAPATGPAGPSSADPVRAPAPTTALAGPDWRTATAEEREHALDRALATGTARELLTDPGYLVHGSVAAITATLADSSLSLPRHLREVWATAAPALSFPGLADSERAALLHAAATGRDPKLAEYLRPLAETSSWTALWSLPRRKSAALAVLPPDPAGPGTAVAADTLGRLTCHSLTDGRTLASPDSGTPWTPEALAAVTPTCLLGLDRSGILHPIPLTTATVPSSAAHLTLHHNAATLASPADLPTAVAAGPRHAAVADGRGRVHLWSLHSPETGPRTIELHRSAVTAVSCLDLPQAGAVLLVTGGLDGTVRLWDSATAEALPSPVESRKALPTALGLADTEAGPVLAVAWSDRRIHLWHLLSGRLAALPTPHLGRALTLTGDGRLLQAGRDGIHAWRLDLAALWAST